MAAGSSTHAGSTSPRGQALPRSRSSKRRRGDGTYAKVAVAASQPATTGSTEYTQLPDGASDADYSTMPTARGSDSSDPSYRAMSVVDGGGDSAEYRTMPSVDDEYGTMPAARSHGYGQVDATYSDLSQRKSVTSAPEQSTSRTRRVSLLIERWGGNIR